MIILWHNMFILCYKAVILWHTMIILCHNMIILWHKMIIFMFWFPWKPFDDHPVKHPVDDLVGNFVKRFWAGRGWSLLGIILWISCPRIIILLIAGSSCKSFFLQDDPSYVLPQACMDVAILDVIHIIGSGIRFSTILKGQEIS